ncbi:MAG: hypothetical protein A3I01_12315 [Betaproteobacteria bacterium RIFCSPLOWO2_02_FULL_65_24]|nr:MAG: hypothetical protein A3I01_12315 [Betaproteobacteria bacterium RIFCSPLOWO2_02_FULL_65_24]
MTSPIHMKISEPSVPGPAPRRVALFNLGFRPFYLLAALFAAVGMLAWMAALEGVGWEGEMSPLAWHQHEMVFGFALAVMAGFLLTAGQVWTGVRMPHGWTLALIAAHWLAARVLLFTGPPLVAAAVDVAFPFVLAAVLGRAIIAAGSRRNYFAVALLCALGLANLWFYLEQAAVGGIVPGLSVQAALYLVMLMVVVIGGRVVPSFTASALPLAGVRVRNPVLDWSALGFTLLAFAGALAAAPAWFVAPAAGAAALLHAVRQWRWAPWATRHRPLLWILHVSHAWIPLGLALLALASLGWVAPDVPLHAFGAGAIGGMIMGMITRTALGHTGRPLQVGWPEIASYVLVHAAALARVAASLLPADAYAALVSAAGHLWALAFILYFVVYLPRLVLPRIDGKPG